uniref:MRH domain-containing protein n=1 Tax=Megaselia scalaris TaxID=36166 RepID=T1GVS8_MEGSC
MKKYKSYGKSSNLTYDKEQGLVMEFNSDVQCGDNKNYSSTILFICNNGDGKPEVTIKGCRIIFEWRTKYACNPKPCEGVHSESGVRFMYDR